MTRYISLLMVLIVGVLILGSHVSSFAAIPQVISYQGAIQVQGQAFTGQGRFRFALVDSANAPWATPFWSNDGMNPPETDVSIEVENGKFHVLLGASPQEPVPTSVFNGDSVYLAIWFNDGTHDVQLLEPNQKLSAVGYAFQADTAQNTTTFNDLTSDQFLRNDQDGEVSGNLNVTETLDVSKVVSDSVITNTIKASDDFSVATVDFDTLPNNAQHSGLTIGKARAMAGQNNGQPYLWLRGNGAHSWILDYTSPGTLWAQSMGAYYNNVKHGNIGFFGTGPTVDYLSVGFGGYAWWNEQSRFMIWKSGRAEFMPEEVVGSESQTEPTAWLVLAPGDTTANSAPVKFKPGSLLTSPEAGALEYDGTNIYFTDQTEVRRPISLGSKTESPVAIPQGVTGSQVIITGIEQDPKTGKISLETKTIVYESGIIVGIE